MAEPAETVTADSLDPVFEALERSAFRRRFRLREGERDQLRERGLETMLGHARTLIARRLAPAAPANDGRQTPFRGHPVFIAQHATACCCRGCLQKWHAIPRGRALTTTEQDYVIAVLRRWLEGQDCRADAAPGGTRQLRLPL